MTSLSYGIQRGDVPSNSMDERHRELGVLAMYGL
jgi:hypothetical protein